MGCCDEVPAGTTTRKPCIDCVRENLGAAMVLFSKVREGHAYELLIVGHLVEAYEVSSKWPRLHEAIGKARDDYLTSERVPDFEFLGKLVHDVVAVRRNNTSRQKKPRPGAKPVPKQAAIKQEPPPSLFFPSDGGPPVAGRFIGTDDSGNPIMEPVEGIPLDPSLSPERIRTLSEDCVSQPVAITLVNGRITGASGPHGLTPTTGVGSVDCFEDEPEDKRPCED